MQSIYKKGAVNGTVVLGMLLLSAIVVVSILRDRIVNQPYREVSITGTGKVEYVPDVAYVTLGVNIEDTTAQGALSRLNAITARVIPAVEALGIAPEKISTQNLSVYPQYYYPSEAPSRISGYTANENITIEISIGTSTDLVGNVIQTASAQGANQVLSVSFDASNVEELKQQAVLEAITDARARAKTVADAAGVKLGKVIGWWENPIYVPGPMPYYGGYGYGAGGGEMGGGGGTPIVPAGSHQVVMQVTVNYSTR